MRGILLAWGMLVATPAMAADRFDLICTAKKTTVHYRVDVPANEYCAGDCAVVLKIASASASTLILEDYRPAYRGDDERRTEVNRASGQWHTFSFSPKLDVTPFTRDGVCEAAPFSGFPTKKF